MKELNELVKKIELWTPSSVSPDPALFELRDMLLDLARLVVSVESTARRANNTASCLANGIQPD